MTPEQRIDVLRAGLRAHPEPIWSEPFHEAWLANPHLGTRARFGAAYAAELSAAVPVIKPGELIVGNNALAPTVSGQCTAFRYGIRLDHERILQIRAAYPGSSARLEEIQSYWTGWFQQTGYCSPLCTHAALAYEVFLQWGIAGMSEYVALWRDVNVAESPECAEWYDCLLSVLDGVSSFIQRHADAALEAAQGETDGARKAELESIARTCRRVSREAPGSFAEAVQLFYFVFWLAGHDSPGPIDRMLFPALEQDLVRGETTLEQAQEIVDCLWLKFEEKEAFGATLGGRYADETDACNALTRLCLSSIQRLRLLSPRTAFRWHFGVCRATYRQACEVIASGASYPALVNDEAMIPSMVERGIAPEHAAEYSFVGCGQTYPHGRGHGSYEDVVINSAKPLELALNDGVDPVSGELLGPRTGQAESFATFESFLEAYRRQMDEHITARIEAVNEYRRRHAETWFDPLRSLLTRSCVERGLDWHQGGADYSEGMVDMVGLTTVTDSLLAIKRAVYETQVLTLGELRDALSANFEGLASLRALLLRRLPKFGNDNDAADDFTAKEVDRINEHIRSHRTVFGGPWGLDIIGWSGAAELGNVTGATPDGRLAGTPLADCAGPAQGRNVRGLTATLNSALKLPHSRAHGPLALSLRFPPSAVRGPEGLTGLRSAVDTYFRGGGQQLQISVAGAAEMRAALDDPDAHRSLMVRVGGYSAYFVQLDRVIQEDMIARSEMNL